MIKKRLLLIRTWCEKHFFSWGDKRYDDKEKLCLFIAPVFVAVFLLIVYAIKGVYPFGSENIAYFDMAQSYIPMYHHTFDVLHGTQSIYFNWNSGLGYSIADAAGNYIFSPFNIFFLFVNRNAILESMSFFLMIKLMVGAFSMSAYVRYTNNSSSKIIIPLLGIAYATSGYIIQYYSNIHFLDVVVIFPLLILALERMLKEDKNTAYIIILTICLIVSIYMSFMISIYLIFKSYLIIKFDIPREQRGTKIGKLAISTVLALMISAFSTIPSIISLMSTQRGENAASVTYLDILFAQNDLTFPIKIFMLYGSEITFALILLLIITYKKEVKRFQQSFIMLLLLMIPICLESTNLLWHTGTYVLFPVRFGYMLSFEALVLIGKAVNEKAVVQIAQKEKFAGLRKGSALLGAGMMPLVVIIIYVFVKRFWEYGIQNINMVSYSSYWLIFLLLFCCYFLVLFSMDSGYIKVVAGGLILIQSFWGLLGFIAPSNNYFDEHSDTFISATINIREYMDIPEDSFSRVKSKDGYLNANYPFILGKPAISNWSYGISSDLQPELDRLGYSINYTRILDSGGTIFTDALLQLKYAIVRGELDNDFYQLTDKTEEFSLYTIPYEIPFAIEVSEEIFHVSKSITGFDYQNEIFQVMTKLDDNLINKYNISEYVKESYYDETTNKYIFKVEFEVEQQQILYIQSDIYFYDIYSFAVNGTDVIVPWLENELNLQYPAAFNNGMLELGIYDNEKVMIEISSMIEDISYLQLGGLQISVMENGTDILADKGSKYETGKKDLKLWKSVEEDSYIFLPIGYNDSWNVKVNGKKGEILPVLGDAFMAIPLEGGDNIIELKYNPRGLMTGIIIAFAGVCLLYLEKRNILLFFNKVTLVQKANTLLLGFLFWGVLLIIYIIPLLAKVIQIFII